MGVTPLPTSASKDVHKLSCSCPWGQGGAKANAQRRAIVQSRDERDMGCPTQQSEDLARDQSLVPGPGHGHRGPVTQKRGGCVCVWRHLNNTDLARTPGRPRRAAWSSRHHKAGTYVARLAFGHQGQNVVTWAAVGGGQLLPQLVVAHHAKSFLCPGRIRTSAQLCGAGAVVIQSRKF